MACQNPSSDMKSVNIYSVLFLQKVRNFNPESHGPIPQASYGLLHIVKCAPVDSICLNRISSKAVTERFPKIPVGQATPIKHAIYAFTQGNILCVL